jgi:hypothetical protein
MASTDPNLPLADGRFWPFAVCEISLIQQNRTTANEKSRRSDFAF